jgi:mediator of RNA polymerase II transcription subunit 14
METSLETANGYSISAAQRIPMKGSTKASYKFLTNLEKMAAGYISHFVHSRALAKDNIQHTFRPSDTIFTPTHTTAVRIPDLYVRFSKLLPSVTWAMDALKICFHGLVAQPDGHHTLIVVGRTKHPMTQLGSTPLTHPQSDVSFHAPSGSFIIRLTAQIGTCLLPVIKEKLTHIHHLIAFVTIIRQFHLNCVSVTLSNIAFRLDATQTIEIRTNTPKPTLRLPANSPQTQLLPYLQICLEKNGLETVIKALLVTLPIMRAFEALKDGPTERFLLVRSLEWFRIDYPGRGLSLDVRLRVKRSKMLWYFTDPASESIAAHPSERKPCEALKRIWAESGDGWFGLGTGAVADVTGHGIGPLLEKADAALLGA